MQQIRIRPLPNFAPISGLNQSIQIIWHFGIVFDQIINFNKFAKLNIIMRFAFVLRMLTSYTIYAFRWAAKPIQSNQIHFSIKI